MMSRTTHKGSEAESPQPFSGTDSIDLRPLSLWNQVSLRVYTQNVLCFPFDDGAVDAATAHLEASLARLAKQRPDFAGRLQLGSDPNKGLVYIRQSPSQTIPLDTFIIREEFGFTYQQLKDEGFPPGAFVHERFAVDGGLHGSDSMVPVFRLRAFFIKGGLLLVLAFHHAFSDGDCVRMFLDCCAAQTAGKAIAHPSDLQFELDPPANGNHSYDTNRKSKFERLMGQCPEYSMLPDNCGPTTPCLQPGGTPVNDIPKTGKVFIFDNKRLKELAKIIHDYSESAFASPPSSYTCLAALTWAHVAKARLQTESYLSRPPSLDKMMRTNGLNSPKTEPSSFLPTNGTGEKRNNRTAGSNGVRHDHYSAPTYISVTTPPPSPIASLYNPVNFKSRLPPATTDRYFGNATAVPMTHSQTADVLLAAGDDSSQYSSSASSSEEAAYVALARLARAIDASIRGVDAGFVQDRLVLFAAAPDPRVLGLAFDPRTPQDLGFNTWRFFAGDTRWVIPGVIEDDDDSEKGRDNEDGDGDESDEIIGRKPDAICRAQGAWNMGGALILPARASSSRHELLVTLPVVSIEKLCQDEGWMAWVEKVVG